MKKQGLLSLVSVLCLAAASPASAQDKVIIKLGTRAPVGSTWHTHLQEAAQKWTELSGGKVELKIFAGGTMGDEGEMLTKMNNNTLQAVAVSTVGLHVIAPDPQAIDLPMLAKNREQYRCLLGKMTPKLEALLADPYREPDKTKKKPAVVVLAWGEIGFTRFFSTTPRPTLAEMRTSKMFSWEGDPDSTKAWQTAGFKPVVLSSADLVPSLQTGKIDALCYPPVLVLAGNMHSKAKYMLDMPYSSLTGVTVAKKEVWDKIPADLRPKLIEVFRTASAKIDQEVRKMEDDSIAKLQKQGVTLVPVKDQAEWQKTMEEVYKTVRGTVVPAQAFDDVRKALNECAQGK
ncbi:MAG: TRAP transporter substrate-binding protein DctP [Myxococcales bacterium]|nr:TRAP transporter substrate-binding protein DctP [Myxococcales bacterium]